MIDPTSFFLTGFFTLCFIGVGWSVWALISNERTFRQRDRLATWIFSSSSEWMTRKQIMDRVAYRDHLSSLARLRDPADLYSDDDETRAMLRRIFAGRGPIVP